MTTTIKTANPSSSSVPSPPSVVIDGFRWTLPAQSNSLVYSDNFAIAAAFAEAGGDPLSFSQNFVKNHKAFPTYSAKNAEHRVMRVGFNTQFDPQCLDNVPVFIEKMNILLVEHGYFLACSYLDKQVLLYMGHQDGRNFPLSVRERIAILTIATRQPSEYVFVDTRSDKPEHFHFHLLMKIVCEVLSQFCNVVCVTDYIPAGKRVFEGVKEQGSKSLSWWKDNDIPVKEHLLYA